MQTIKCDRCLKAKKSNFKNDKWTRFNVYGPEIYNNFDLCGNCAVKLMNYFKKYLKLKERKK